jgi:hypothetical protein
VYHDRSDRGGRDAAPFFVRGGVMRRRLVSVNGTAAQERGAECSDRKRNGAASYDLDVDVGIR